MDPETPAVPEVGAARRRLYALFLLSGAAGLIYQVVWSRLLHEIFGVTVQAVTAVLATFLGGLALGAWWLGPLADRSRNPLRLYGLLELAIGGAALAGTLLIRALVPLYGLAAGRLGPDSLALTGVRVVLAALVVLPATLLMGGTLPAITRVLVSRATEVTRELSTLYALNTAGAVAGCLAAGFVLIRAFGLHVTLAIAVALNLLVAAVSLVLSRAVEVRPAVRARCAPSVPGGAGLLGMMGLSGFVSLGLEVLWTRMLVLRIGTTTYAFVTVLASFLTGIALGSVLVRVGACRLARPRRVFGWLQVLIAASSLATLPLIGAGWLAQWIEGHGSAWLFAIFARFGVSFLILLVPATLIGATLPVACAIRVREIDSLGADLGRIYGANTLGNVAGATLTGFVLLPLFGLQRGVALLAAASLVAAAWGLLGREHGAPRRAAAWPTGLVAALSIATIALLVLWRPEPFPAWDEAPGDRTLFYREGAAGTVKVIGSASDPRHTWMAVDGIRIGESIGGVDAKQQALAHFPFLLMADRAPRDVLSIGLGTGVLIGEVARHDVASAECVEISPEVIAGAELFETANHGALDNPRVRVIHDDGYHYLRRTDRRYDAIISDAKSRRGHAGNSVFFSADYYELCRRHLAPDGLLIQWVPLDAPPRELSILLRTLVLAFPHAYVWIAPPHSLFLVGSERPLTLDLEHVARVLRDPATADLLRYGFTDAYGFVSALVLDRKGVVARVGEQGLRNTLERPVLEFYSPRDYAEPPWLQRAQNLETLRPVAGESCEDLRVVNADAGLLSANRTAMARFLESAAIAEGSRREDAARGYELLRSALAIAPANGLLRYTAPGSLSRLLSLAPASAEGQMLLGSLLESRGLLPEAAAAYGRALEAVGGADAEALHRLAIVRAKAGDLGEAAALLGRALRLAPEDPGLFVDLGRVSLLRGRPDEAVRATERAASLTGRRNAEVLGKLAQAYAATGSAERAQAVANEALSLAIEQGDGALVDELRRSLADLQTDAP